MRPFLAALLTTIVPALVGRRWIRGPAALRWGLGSMIGIALIGWGTMLGGLLGSAEAGALFFMTAGWFAGRSARRRARDPGRRPPIIAVAAIAIVGSFLLSLSLSRPVPGYDAWAIWSMKGKAIAASGDFSSPVFTEAVYQYAHRDYPPLLPSWQATAYGISGDPTVGFPTQFQLAWLWTAAGLAIVSLAGRRRTVTGLALVAWLVAPEVVGELMSGYADVPMALFLVVGIVALLRAEDLGFAPGALLLAAASLTKTEGLMLAVATVAPLLATRRYRRPAVLAGATIVLAFGPWAAFTVSHGLMGDLTRPALGDENVATERDAIERLPIVLRSFGSEAIRPGKWGILLPASVLALVVSRLRPSPLVAGFLLSAGALTVIYLITPYDLDWHLSHSANRVVIAPLGLLALAVEGIHLVRPSDT